MYPIVVFCLKFIQIKVILRINLKLQLYGMKPMEERYLQSGNKQLIAVGRLEHNSAQARRIWPSEVAFYFITTVKKSSFEILSWQFLVTWDTVVSLRIIFMRLKLVAWKAWDVKVAHGTKWQPIVIQFSLALRLVSKDRWKRIGLFWYQFTEQNWEKCFLYANRGLWTDHSNSYRETKPPAQLLYHQNSCVEKLFDFSWRGVCFAESQTTKHRKGFQQEFMAN